LQARIRMKAILKTIEQWASESDDRVKLLIILVWAGFGVLAVLSTLIVAWVMLPPDFRLF
jgi:hypothetical protein